MGSRDRRGLIQGPASGQRDRADLTCQHPLTRSPACISDWSKPRTRAPQERTFRRSPIGEQPLRLSPPDGCSAPGAKVEIGPECGHSCVAGVPALAIQPFAESRWLECMRPPPKSDLTFVKTVIANLRQIEAVAFHSVDEAGLCARRQRQPAGDAAEGAGLAIVGHRPTVALRANGIWIGCAPEHPHQ